MFGFFFFFGCTPPACRILVPQPGIEPVPPAVEAQSPWSLFLDLRFKKFEMTTPRVNCPSMDVKESPVSKWWTSFFPVCGLGFCKQVKQLSMHFTPPYLLSEPKTALGKTEGHKHLWLWLRHFIQPFSYFTSYISLYKEHLNLQIMRFWVYLPTFVLFSFLYCKA